MTGGGGLPRRDAPSGRRRARPAGFIPHGPTHGGGRQPPSCPALLAAAALVLTAAAAASERYPLPIREHLLANGLRLLVLERPGDARVACKIFTDMGALVEEPGELGAAHFLEHLMFKGTRTLGTVDWERERPLMESIAVAEAELIEARNLARNDLQQRGVFGDYRHAASTPRIERAQAEIARLVAAAAKLRKNGAMMRWYQAFGGSRLTASTEQEYMKFDINLPVERVDLFLRVEADRMRNSVFREFDEERMILVEQRLGDLNRPTTPYYEQMNAVVGLVHPVFWPEGYPTDFYQYTRQSQRDLYRRYFVPNNTTLVFVGGVSLERMVPAVEHYFGWMERAPEPAPTRAIEPIPAAERRLIYRSDELAPRVELRFLIPGIGHPDRPHFDVLAEVASRALEDALGEAEIEAEVNVNTQVVHTARFGVPSSINVEAVVEEEVDLDATEGVLCAVVAALGETAVPPDRLARAKKQLRTAWYRTAQNADALGFEIGHFQTMDHWTTLAAHLEAREATTADDLKRLARRYFVAENRTVGIVRAPEPASVRPSEGVSR